MCVLKISCSRASEISEGDTPYFSEWPVLQSRWHLHHQSKVQQGDRQGPVSGTDAVPCHKPVQQDERNRVPHHRVHDNLSHRHVTERRDPVQSQKESSLSERALEFKEHKNEPTVGESMVNLRGLLVHTVCTGVHTVSHTVPYQIYAPGR